MLPILPVLAISAGVYAMLPSVDFPNVDAFNTQILRASKKYNVPYSILKGLIATESAFNPKIKNPNSSALGLTQIIKSTAEGMGYKYYNLVDPDVAIDAGANYLSQQMRKFGMIEGVRAYYTGPGTLDKVIKGRYSELSSAQKSHYQDSHKYVAKVMGYAVKFAIRDLGEFA